MSIEIVTAPKKGVTVSLAGRKMFSGHLFCITLDAIRTDSAAYDHLVSTADREVTRSLIHYNRMEARRKVDDLQTALNRLNDLKNGNPSSSGPSWFRFDGERVTGLLKKSVIEKLDGLASRLYAFVDSAMKDETPDSAQ
jgi:hypothetical protein